MLPDTLPSEIAAIATEFRAIMAARFGSRLREIRLFGSYARGDARPESDVDVVVVVDRLSRIERREIFEAAADLYFEYQRRLSPLALSVEEYDTLRDREYLIAGDIAREGIPL